MMPGQDLGQRQSVATFCWWCGGFGTVPRFGGGYQPCYQCRGTGYGETLEAYRARCGLKPEAETPHRTEPEQQP